MSWPFRVTTVNRRAGLAAQATASYEPNMWSVASSIAFACGTVILAAVVSCIFVLVGLVCHKAFVFLRTRIKAVRKFKNRPAETSAHPSTTIQPVRPQHQPTIPPPPPMPPRYSIERSVPAPAIPNQGKAPPQPAPEDPPPRYRDALAATVALSSQPPPLYEQVTGAASGAGTRVQDVPSTVIGIYTPSDGAAETSVLPSISAEGFTLRISAVGR